MILTDDHRLAMQYLPPFYRWQSEAQLKGQTGLGDKTREIFAALAEAGFCEFKSVSIIHGLTGEPMEYVRCYRMTITTMRKYSQALKKAHDHAAL